MLAKPLVLILLACSLGLASCSNNDNPIITPTADPVSATNNEGPELVIEPVSLNLQVGRSTQASSLFNQEGEIKRGLPTTWSSLNPDIVSVDEDGNVTALRPGNTRIRAVTLGEEALALVTVTAAGAGSPPATEAPPAQPDGGLSTVDEDSENSEELAKLRTIVIRPENEVIQPTLFKFSRLGETRQFVALGKDAEGQDIPNLTFSWSSSNEDAATVNTTGVVTAVATGTSNLIASAGNITSNIVQVVVQEGTIRANIRFTE